jgi:hypothetical protein
MELEAERGVEMDSPTEYVDVKKEGEETPPNGGEFAEMMGSEVPKAPHQEGAGPGTATGVGEKTDVEATEAQSLHEDQLHVPTPANPNLSWEPRADGV